MKGFKLKAGITQHACARNSVRLSSFALSLSKGEWASTSSARTANRTVLGARGARGSVLAIANDNPRAPCAPYIPLHPAIDGLPGEACLKNEVGRASSSTAWNNSII